MSAFSGVLTIHFTILNHKPVKGAEKTDKVRIMDYLRGTPYFTSPTSPGSGNFLQ